MKKFLHILTWLCWILSGAGLFVLLGFARDTYLSSPLKTIQLKVEHNDVCTFLPEDSVRFQIDQLYGRAIGQPMRRINIEKLTQTLSVNPWVKSVKASTAIDGILKVEVSERRPVIRVFSSDGHSVYLDEEGFAFITQAHNTARVQMASGNIAFPPLPFNRSTHISNKIYRKTPLADLLKIGKQIESDPFADALIDQIYVSSLGEYELSPKVGHVNIIIGDTTDIAEKIEKLSAFYKEKAGSQEFQQYQTINLKFKHQIVCIKKLAI
ncbi:MAG: hypothetical protein KGZ82_05375 [Bacteroidales bacterium]|nr:hypothetical protein [Bacteroidales bacterium]